MCCMYSELPVFFHCPQKKHLKNRLASPPSTLVQTLTDSVHFFIKCLLSVMNVFICLILFWLFKSLGETTCLQGLSLFCCSKLRGKLKKKKKRHKTDHFQTCEDVDMRNVFLHEVSIIKDVSHIVFVIFILLKACTCSGSCVFCHGHLKAVCRF